MSYEYRRTAGRKRKSSSGWSGPGPDDRDPKALGEVLGKLVADRGWREPAAKAGVFARWPEMVGSEIAEHCRPVSCTDGELVIEAESSAWATQLRLFKTQILARLAAGTGRQVVTRIRIHGPSQPSYVSGPRRVRFR